jgi:tetratricopeptide (TPR) repeat protein
MGQAGRVFAEVERLLSHMRTLPATPGPNEAAPVWNVREVLLDTGGDAARQLGRWQDALDLNAAQIASKRDRRAPAADVARSRFNDYGPLLRLGRTGQALDLLLDCRQVFQDANDIGPLGKTLSALADTENERGHGDAAIRMERDALRYKYLAGDVIGIAVSYYNLGNYLRRHARQPAPALACHLAAALIRALTGADGAGRSVRAAADDLREFGAAAATPPADVAALCGQIGEIPGADLHRLLTVLAPDPAAAEQALRQLVTQAQAEAETPS